MNDYIYAISTNQSFLILKSIGVKVLIVNEEELDSSFHEALNNNAKIIFYGNDGEMVANKINERNKDNMYPILLKLPINEKEGYKLDDLKTLIEKSIGISII